MDPNSMGMNQHLAYLMPVIGLFFLIGFAVLMVPLWQICKKAGFSPWLSLLVFVPLGMLILLYILAFAQWKSSPYAAAYPPTYPPPSYPPVEPPRS